MSFLPVVPSEQLPGAERVGIYMAQGCSEVILGSLLEHSLPPVEVGSTQLHVGSNLLLLLFHTWVLVQ